MKVALVLLLLAALAYYILKDVGVIVSLNGWAIAFFVLAILIVGLVISFVSDFEGPRF